MKRFSLLAVQKDRKSLVLPDVSDVRVRKVTERQSIVCQAQDSKRSEANKKDTLSGKAQNRTASVTFGHTCTKIEIHVYHHCSMHEL